MKRNNNNNNKRRDDTIDDESKFEKNQEIHLLCCMPVSPKMVQKSEYKWKEIKRESHHTFKLERRKKTT